MYNILLTDDEQIVIDTLSLILNRNFQDEVQIFTALSGTKALETVRTEKIDIIFMDIHMPGINGLETISLIKQLNPNIIIVILSAYDQFQYAQEAINLGAYKYLTKPVNRNLIIQTVRNCMNLVDTKRGAFSNNLELHEKLNFVSSIVESDFIYSCIFSNSSTDFSSYLDYFEIKDDSYFMCCIELPGLDQEKRYDAYMKVRDILTSKGRCILGSFMTNRVGAFFPLKKTSDDEVDSFEDRQKDLMQMLHALLSQNLSSKIRIGVSQVESDIQQASQVYNNALTALNSTSTSGGISFYADSLIQNHENAQIKRIQDLTTRILNRIKVADAGSVSQLISEFVNLLFDAYSGQKDILKNKLIEFIFSVRLCTTEIIPDYKNEAFDKAFATLCSTDDRDVIERFISVRCLECVTAIAGSLSAKTNPIIQKACEYIEENIDKDISLDQLADYLGVSSFYLSKLFKEERKGMWSVQFGTLKMTVKEKDLTPVSKPKDEYKPSISIDLAEPDVVKSNFSDFAPSLSGLPTNHPVFELRLLGMRVEEALKLLERQLDLCAMQNFHEFSIIHGKGTGALQQAVIDYLSNYPGVQDFHFAPPEDGGSGKTYVKM